MFYALLKPQRIPVYVYVSNVDSFEWTCNGEITCIGITIVQGIMGVQILIVRHSFMRTW